jgi:hypothetical protein
VKTLEDYMRDPSVANDPLPLREVHAIRLMIYDETKDMTPSDLTAYYHNNLMEAQREYGFKVVKSAKMVQ